MNACENIFFTSFTSFNSFNFFNFFTSSTFSYSESYEKCLTF